MKPLLVWLHLLACAAPAAAAEGPVTLSVLGTNDLHGRLESLPWLSAHVRLVRRARAADGGGVLLVDAGDMFQGTLESNEGEGAAVIDAYNALGYDAAAIGNHELDFGPEGPAASARGPDDDPRGALKARARQARFPLLTANVVDAASGRPVSWPNVRPAVLLERAGVRVGIVGVVTTATPRATLPANFRGLAVTALAPAITREARALRRRGAQVVIVAAHEGGRCRRFEDPDDLSSCDPQSPIFAVARALPRGLVDVIVAGHRHDGLAHRVAGIAIVSAYSGGRAFGRVDLRVDRGRVLAAQPFPPRFVCGADAPVPRDPAACRPERYEGEAVVPDASLAARLAPAFERARLRREAPLGVMVLRPVTRALREESPLGNLVADLLREARPEADVGLTNGGGLRADLPAGPLTYGQLYEAFPFDNGFARVRLRAEVLARAIARNLGNDGGVVSVSGVRAIARCAAGRLEVTLEGADGRPLARDRVLDVVTSDFLATGGDGLFTGLPVERTTFEGDLLQRDAMAGRLRRRGGTLSGDDRALFDPARPRLVLPGPRPVRCTRPGR